MKERTSIQVSLTGFMGTGKTETGKALAELLGLEFVDLDRLIEAREGVSVSDIFSNHGEKHFRELEARAVHEVSGQEGVVIATGGGAVLDPKNVEALSRKGTIVLLEASVEKILERVGEDATRPLLQATPDQDRKTRIESLLATRAPAYEKIGFRVDTSSPTPLQAACRIAASLDLSPNLSIPLDVPAGAMRPHPADEERDGPRDRTIIEIGRGLLSRLGERLKVYGLDRRAFILIPPNVSEPHLDQIAASVDAACIPWQEIRVQDGDAEKNLEQAGALLEKIAEEGASRDHLLVAVGGGVTGDLAGFAASVYMRGIALVQVPTTLLAQVDASIGGKTGVNLPVAKNLVGTFYPPRLVLSDPCVLRTLPDHEISNGMAEVVKTALLGAPGLFDLLDEALADDPVRPLRSIDLLERCVVECARIKAGIVERDPFEKGERMVLNLGHTLGHAFEALGGYTKLSHGQAVSIGLVAALRIALARKRIDRTLFDRTVKILEACGLPVIPPPVDREKFFKSLYLDKKKKKDRLRFVLPERLGLCRVVEDVTEKEIEDTLHAIDRIK